MIPVEVVHRKLDRRLNRLASDHASVYTVPDKDDAINRGIKIWQENRTALAETNSTAREQLRDLLFSGVSLDRVKSNDEFTAFKYPSNMYRRLRQKATCSIEGCPIRPLRVTLLQRDDLSKTEIDEFWRPTFEWAETIAVESRDGLEIYHQKQFTINSASIDYYMEIPEVYAPSLVKNGVYKETRRGTIITKDQDFLLDNDYQLDSILTIAALLLRVARGDEVEFQLELSNALNIDKLYLN